MTDVHTARAVDRRRFLQVAGLGAVGAASLTACTKKAAPRSKEVPTEGVSGAQQLELGAETSGVEYAPGYVGPKARSIAPFGKGKKFRIVVPQETTVIGKWNTNAYSKWLEQRTGVEVEYQEVQIFNPDGTQDLTKVNAMIASGDLPDAFLAIPFSASQVSVYGQQGLFTALDKFVQTYAPQTRQAFKDYPDFRPTIAASDNKLYQMRTLVDCYHCRIGLARTYINEKYVQAVGGTMPTTTEQFRETLKLLKAKDPTPNKNIIPFAASVSNPIDRFMMDPFLYNPGGDTGGGWMVLDGDKVEFVANTDEWREGLKFLRGLSDDGTLTRQVFTMTDDAFLAAGNQGRLGSARGYYWGVFIDVNFTGKQQWRDYAPLLPLKGPKGVQYASWDHYLFNGASSLIVTKKCSDPTTLVRWADAQMELEGTISGGLGPRSTGNWGYAKAGDKGLNGKQGTLYQVKYPPPLGTSWNSFNIGYQSSDERLSQVADAKNPSFEGDLYEGAKGYFKYAQPRDKQLPPLIFDTTTAGAVADTATAIHSHVTQSMAKFAIGELDINSGSAWKSYVDTFKKIGLAKYLDMYQKAYDTRPR